MTSSLLSLRFVGLLSLELSCMLCLCTAHECWYCYCIYLMIVGYLQWCDAVNCYGIWYRLFIAPVLTGVPMEAPFSVVIQMVLFEFGALDDTSRAPFVFSEFYLLLDLSWKRCKGILSLFFISILATFYQLKFMVLLLLTKHVFSSFFCLFFCLFFVLKDTSWRV